MRKRRLAQRGDGEDSVGGYSIAALMTEAEPFAPDDQTGFDQSRRQARHVGAPHRPIDRAPKFARVGHSL